MNKRSQKYNSYNKSKTSSKKKLEINFSKWIFPFVLTGLLVYSIFTFLSFRSIKTSNPLENDNSNIYLLSQRKDTLKKTLIVFENEVEGQDRIENVYIFVRNNDKGESILLSVPTWLYYGGLENDFGNAVPVSSFKYAGEFLQQGRGVGYAIWQIEQLLAINFDSYIWFSPEAVNAVEENLGGISGDLMYGAYYQNGKDLTEDSLYLNSFLSHLNWLKLVFNASKFKDSQAVIYSDNASLMGVFLDLKNIEKQLYSTKPYLLEVGSSSNIVSKQSDNLGGMVNFLNIAGFDSTWRNLSSKLLDKDLEQERVRVEIYNGSGISGAAGQFARKIENAGCDVVRFDNAPEDIDNTLFYVPNPDDYSNSLSVISELFPGSYESIEGRPTFMTTGDIVIILGKDISRMYSF